MLILIYLSIHLAINIFNCNFHILCVFIIIITIISNSTFVSSNKNLMKTNLIKVVFVSLK